MAAAPTDDELAKLIAASITVSGPQEPKRLKDYVIPKEPPPPRPKPTRADVVSAQERTAGLLHALPTMPTVNLTPTRRRKAIRVAGFRLYQAALREIDSGRLSRGEPVIVDAFIVPEPWNTKDGAAILVAVHTQQIGHLLGVHSGQYWASGATQKMIARGLAGICVAQLNGGTVESPIIGVTLRLASEEYADKMIGLEPA